MAAAAEIGRCAELNEKATIVEKWGPEPELAKNTILPSRTSDMFLALVSIRFQT